MLKVSGLFRAHPRLSVHIRWETSAASTGVLQAAQTIFHLLWRSVVILCLAFSGITIVTFSGVNTAFPEGLADAFLPYQVIYLGLSLKELGSSACSLYTISPYTHQEECDLRLFPPVTGAFRKVIVTIQGDYIVQIRFQCGDLYVGNLVRHWGRPDEIIHVLTGYVLRWTKRGIVAQVRGSQWFHYQLPVKTVILT